MFVVTNAIHVQVGYGEELLKGFKERKGIEQSPGFIRMEILRTEGLEEYEEYRVCTTWKNKEAFLGWTKSEAFRAAHHAKREKKDYVIGNQVSMYETVLSYDPQVMNN
ncbi:antibiotic biosynthesis monooxygenase [Bacillus sp. REN10]|uniref:antibiotic biosynthesis monooxygenase n=1 Tax=Bacillus sp. REN10 TaxID=2782541 RepID=UPI00193BD406|nr:antibiotic biosynthesis monooxygenase [Bacillus sp. REN10]